MTQTADKAKNAPRIIKSVLVFLAFMIFSVFASDSVSREILDGLIFAVNVILPTVFPFMVLSDFAARCLEFEKSKFLSLFFAGNGKIQRKRWLNVKFTLRRHGCAGDHFRGGFDYTLS